MEFSKKNELTFEQNHCDLKIGGCVSQSSNNLQNESMSVCLSIYNVEDMYQNNLHAGSATTTMAIYEQKVQESGSCSVYEDSCLC